MLILSGSVFSVHSGISSSSSVGHYMHRAAARQILPRFSSCASAFSLIFFFLCACAFSNTTVCWALAPLGLIPQAFLESRSYNSKGCRKSRADQWTQSCCAVVFSTIDSEHGNLLFSSHMPLPVTSPLLSQKVSSQKLPSFLFG